MVSIQQTTGISPEWPLPSSSTGCPVNIICSGWSQEWIILSFFFSLESAWTKSKYFKMIRNALGAWFPVSWFILRIIFSTLARIIADNKEEESEEMLAPGPGPSWLLVVYVIHKRKVFHSFDRGRPPSGCCCLSTDHGPDDWGGQGELQGGRNWLQCKIDVSVLS